MDTSIRLQAPRLSRLPHPLPQEFVVGMWEVMGRQVVVKRAQDGFTYTYEGKESALSSDLVALYGNGTRAVNLIRLFHDVIQLNLRETVSDQAFLPFLCTDGFVKKQEEGEVDYKRTTVQTALFCQQESDLRKDQCKRITTARWGVFNPLDRTISIHQVDDVSEAMVFLKKVRFRNIQKYNQNFNLVKPVIILDVADRVQSIYLIKLCASECDPNKAMSAENWAITVVNRNDGQGATYGITNFGHAMMFLEGVKEGCQFFEYAHITNKSTKEERLSEFVARVEIRSSTGLHKETLLRFPRGPTWIRPREDVERMMVSIRDAQANRRHVRFSETRGVVSDYAALAAGGGVATILGVAAIPGVVPLVGALFVGFVVAAVVKMFGALIEGENPSGVTDTQNCAFWLLEQLKKSGIEVDVPPTMIRIISRIYNGSDKITIKDLSNPEKWIDFISTCINIFDFIVPKPLLKKHVTPKMLVNEMEKNTLNIKFSSPEK